MSLCDVTEPRESVWIRRVVLAVDSVQILSCVLTVLVPGHFLFSLWSEDQNILIVY